MPRLPASVTEPTHEYKSIHLELPPLLYKRNKYDTKAWMEELQRRMAAFMIDLEAVMPTADYVSTGSDNGCIYSCDTYCTSDHKSGDALSVYVQYTRPPTDEEVAQRKESYQKLLETKKEQRRKVAEDKKAALRKQVKANKAQVLKILEELDNE